jgi:hypothetical protein
MVQELTTLPSDASYFGKGLAQSIPKELEYQRTKAGLSELVNNPANQDLNPQQYLAKISSVYGVTPQMIQSFGELAKLQRQGNAYKNSAGGNPRPGQQTGGISPQASPEAQISYGQPRQPGEQMPPQGPVNNLQRTPNQNANEDIPQVIPGNPLNQENLTRLPWTPQQRQASTADYINMGFLPDQAAQLTADDEARDLATPGAHKQRQADINEARTKVRDTLKRHLETKLQKTGEAVNEDVNGRMILNAERGMERDLIENPKRDIENVANDWSERLYYTAVAKGKLNSLGAQTGLENLLKGKQSEKQLKEYQDIFKRSGNLEEFKDILQGEKFGMSSIAASSVAFPPSPKVEKYISSYRPSLSPKALLNKDQEARKAALEIEKEIGPDDSIQSILRKLSEKDPFFDKESFLDQISEDKDQIRLNARQRNELGERKNILPNWADILYLGK